MLKTSCSWQVLHAATLGCDVSLMEPALKEAEEGEAEIEAAHRQAQTDVKRKDVRCMNRYAEMPEIL